MDAIAEPVVAMESSVEPEPVVVVESSAEPLVAMETTVVEPDPPVVVMESSAEPVAAMETNIVEPEPLVLMDSSAEPLAAMDSSDEPPTKKRKPSSSNFIWDVKNFSKLNNRRHYSDVFVLDGYEWRILIFPKGDGREYLSIFLYVVDAGILPYGWTRDTQFTLSVISQENDKYTVKREISYVFNGQKDDCGHKYFMPLAEVYDSSKGYLVNDTLKIEVEIVVSNDLKPETAYVGPENQVVNFRRLEKPTEDVFCLELSMRSSYDEVLQRVASKVGSEDSFLQLRRHDSLSDKPEENSIESTVTKHLYDLLLHNNEKICDVLYYDVLNIPTVGSKDSEAQHSRTSSCAVCWNAPKQGVCIPCGHMSSCMSCMEAVQRKDFTCPICRAKIKKVVRVYVI